MAADYQAEREAFLRFAKVINEIEECRNLFEIAGTPMPEPLQRFFGTPKGSTKPSVPNVRISAPHRESRPAEAPADWISVEIGEASATSLVLAVLREANKPVLSKDVANKFESINPRFPGASIHNIATRLK